MWTVLQPSGGQWEDKVRKFGADSDVGRPGQPVELAQIFVLGSGEARFTAETASADGGNDP